MFADIVLKSEQRAVFPIAESKIRRHFGLQRPNEKLDAPQTQVSDESRPEVFLKLLCAGV